MKGFLAVIVLLGLVHLRCRRAAWYADAWQTIQTRSWTANSVLVVGCAGFVFFMGQAADALFLFALRGTKIVGWDRIAVVNAAWAVFFWAGMNALARIVEELIQIRALLQKQADLNPSKDRDL